jgi:hypothetical protein
MKRIFSIMLAAMLLAFFVSGCSNQGAEAPVKPPADSLTVRTLDGNGVITLVMRPFENSLTAKDVENINAEAEKLLGNVYQPEGPRVSSSTTFEGASEPRLVAYCYAVYSDRIPEPCSFWSANDRSLDVIYDRAQQWFFDELAGIEHF